MEYSSDEIILEILQVFYVFVLYVYPRFAVRNEHSNKMSPYFQINWDSPENLDSGRWAVQIHPVRISAVMHSDLVNRYCVCIYIAVLLSTLPPSTGGGGEE